MFSCVRPSIQSILSWIYIAELCWRLIRRILGALSWWCERLIKTLRKRVINAHRRTYFMKSTHCFGILNFGYSFYVCVFSLNDDPISSARSGPHCDSPTRLDDYMCYKHVSLWSDMLKTTEACVSSCLWAGTPTGTSSSIGQRVVFFETVAEGGAGGGGGGEITMSGSPARSESNLQRIFSEWSPPNAVIHFNEATLNKYF